MVAVELKYDKCDSKPRFRAIALEELIDIFGLPGEA